METPNTYATPFLTRSATHPEPESLVDLCLEGLSGPDLQCWNLGFLYASADLEEHLGTLLDQLKIRTSIAHWVGTCGAGLIHDAVELYEEKSICLMLCAFPDDAFRVFAPVHKEATELTAQHGSWLKQDDFHFGLVHADPRNMKTAELLDTLAEASGNGFLVGGLTVAQAHFPQITDLLSSGGVGGVLFNSQTPVRTCVSQGCEKITANMTVTDSIKNIVVELDNQPALDVLMNSGKALGLESYEDVATHILSGLPVPGSDTQGFLVRPITGIDPDNKLFSITEATDKGDAFHFCRFSPDTAINALEQDLKATMSRLPVRPKGGVYISCASRGKNLFPPAHSEIAIVQQALGDIPLVGFFANGEIAANRVHSFSSVLTLFL